MKNPVKLKYLFDVEKMLVSIVLTCYKQEKFIEETILSVINQKYDNRELLIGDDSPDDNCRNIISKYTKKYPDKIHAWHHNPNKGIVNNMQFLIEQRNKESEYVAFLEGDDCLFPEYLEKKLEIFKNHPNVQLVYNELTTIDENSNIIVEKILKFENVKFCKKGKIGYEKLLHQFYYKSWSSLMVKSDVFDRYSIWCDSLGRETLVSDIYFFNLIANNEDIFGIDTPLVYYRKYEDSVSGSLYGSVNIYLDIVKYTDYLFKQGFIENGFYKSQKCKYLFAISIVFLKLAFKNGVFTTLKMFCIGLINGIVYRLKKVIGTF